MLASSFEGCLLAAGRRGWCCVDSCVCDAACSIRSTLVRHEKSSTQFARAVCTVCTFSWSLHTCTHMHARVRDSTMPPHTCREGSIGISFMTPCLPCLHPASSHLCGSPLFLSSVSLLCFSPLFLSPLSPLTPSSVSLLCLSLYRRGREEGCPDESDGRNGRSAQKLNLFAPLKGSADITDITPILVSLSICPVVTGCVSAVLQEGVTYGRHWPPAVADSVAAGGLVVFMCGEFLCVFLCLARSPSLHPSIPPIAISVGAWGHGS